MSSFKSYQDSVGLQKLLIYHLLIAIISDFLDELVCEENLLVNIDVII